jgi:CubicO group peptidase (beta-lactamase class C family)
MNPEGNLYYPEHWGDFPPGNDYYYTNIGYILLGYLIEQISGQSFEDYCNEHILQPLSMNNSSFFINDLNNEKLAIPYLWNHGIYYPLPHFELNCFNSAGGLFSNINDLSKYLLVHMNEGVYNGIKILNKSTIDEMHTIQYPNGNYGLGWGIIERNNIRREGHSGSIPCFGSMMFSVNSSSSENFGIIYFWNENIYGAPMIGLLRRMKVSSLREKLWDLLYEKALRL